MSRKLAGPAPRQIGSDQIELWQSKCEGTRAMPDQTSISPSNTDTAGPLR